MASSHPSHTDDFDPRRRPWPPPGQPGEKVQLPVDRTTIVATLPRSGRVVVEGQVRGLQLRTAGMESRQEILSFRIERYDEAGNRAVLIPVEVRGLTIQGALADGDWVRASGRVRSGTLLAREVLNVSTGATVTAMAPARWWAIVVAIVLLLIVLTGIVLLIVTIRSFPENPFHALASGVPAARHGSHLRWASGWF